MSIASKSTSTIIDDVYISASAIRIYRHRSLIGEISIQPRMPITNWADLGVEANDALSSALKQHACHQVIIYWSHHYASAFPANLGENPLRYARKKQWLSSILEPLLIELNPSWHITSARQWVYGPGIAWAIPTSLISSIQEAYQQSNIKIVDMFPEIAGLMAWHMHKTDQAITIELYDQQWRSIIHAKENFLYSYDIFPQSSSTLPNHTEAHLSIDLDHRHQKTVILSNLAPQKFCDSFLPPVKSPKNRWILMASIMAMASVLLGHIWLTWQEHQQNKIIEAWEQAQHDANDNMQKVHANRQKHTQTFVSESAHFGAEHTQPWFEVLSMIEHVFDELRHNPSLSDASKHLYLTVMTSDTSAHRLCIEGRADSINVLFSFQQMLQQSLKQMNPQLTRIDHSSTGYSFSMELNQP